MWRSPFWQGYGVSRNVYSVALDISSHGWLHWGSVILGDTQCSFCKNPKNCMKSRKLAGKRGRKRAIEYKSELIFSQMELNISYKVQFTNWEVMFTLIKVDKVAIENKYDSFPDCLVKINDPFYVIQWTVFVRNFTMIGINHSETYSVSFTLWNVFVNQLRHFTQ